MKCELKYIAHHSKSVITSTAWVLMIIIMATTIRYIIIHIGISIYIMITIVVMLCVILYAIAYEWCKRQNAV